MWNRIRSILGLRRPAGIPETLTVCGEEMTREMVLAMFVYRSCESLCEKGLMTGPVVLTPKAHEAIAELDRLGIRPTNAQFQQAIAHVLGGAA